MNIDQFRDRLIVFGTTLAGIVVSLYCGKLAGAGQFGTLATILFIVAIGLMLLFLRDRIWMIIPICWPLYGHIDLLPLPFSVKDMAVLITIPGVIILIAFRVIQKKPTFGILDILLWLNTLWLVFAFIRHPTGFSATDSDRVGGRPYFDCAIALAAYWIVSRAVPNTKSLRRLPWYAFGMLFIFFSVNVVILFVPQIAPFVAPFYSGFDFSQVASMLPTFQEAGDAEFARYEFFRDIGRCGVIALCAYFYPPTLLSPLRPLRFLLFMGLMAGLLLSGFRSFIVYAGGMFILGSYFRNGIGSSIKAVVIGVVAILIVMLGHGTIYKLPFAAQRALAFVPEPLRVSKLDDIAVDAGTGSTSWRTEMWIMALTTNRYIENKTLGDGFGTTKRQLADLERMAARGGVDFRESQEAMAMVGNYHSGPVSTVHVSGYIGLALMVITMLLVARYAFKTIKACKGTPIFAPAMFFCMPVVFEPFWFNLIYGGYTSGFINISLGLGLTKMVENSLEAWKAEEAVATTDFSDKVPVPGGLPELLPQGVHRA